MLHFRPIKSRKEFKFEFYNEVTVLLISYMTIPLLDITV